ncbi:MAG TPA: peptidase M48 [Sedimenticola thiotaurini]|uniref:Peptidase M48 n=1 Tax=Sedimenticola thiotaurini TaxID=1543721 RepID=A0A831RLI5_9GAMM|nr:peptidase M48 [Sedimenticola thiotaurini]
MNAIVWQRHALANRLQSLLLLLAMGGLLALLGSLFWGREGAFWLLAVCGVLILINPMASPGLILGLYHARPLTREQAPLLHAALEELSRRAELPNPPRLYYIPSSMVNAFSLGRGGQAAVAVTDGLVNSLNEREIIGVLAHEISHIANGDMWVMGLADLFSRMTAMLSLFGQFLLFVNLPLIMMAGKGIAWLPILLLIFAPNLSALAQLGLSRTREYDADLNAARLTGDPEGLASALQKIEQKQQSLLGRILLPGQRIPEPSMLRTHPPTAERIRRLMELKRQPGEGPPVFREPALSIPHRPPFDPAVERQPRLHHVSRLWH